MALFPYMADGMGMKFQLVYKAYLSIPIPFTMTSKEKKVLLWKILNKKTFFKKN